MSAWSCTAGCGHVWNFRDGTERVRLMSDAHMGQRPGGHGWSGATCVCCADKDVSLLVTRRDGTKAEPMPCNQSMHRCPTCLMIDGVHVANCTRHPDRTPRSDTFLAA